MGNTGVALIYDFADNDAATVTASAAHANFPVTNIKKSYPGRVWKEGNNNPGPKWLKWDFGVSKSANYILLAGCNFAAADPISAGYPKLFAHTSNLGDTEALWNPSLGGTGTSVGQLVHNNGNYLKLRFSALTSFRWWFLVWKHELVDPMNAEVGRAVIATHLQLPYPMDNVWDDSFLSTSTESEAGHEKHFPVGIIRPALREAVFDFHKQKLTNDDRKNLVTMLKSVDRLKPFFVDPHPDDTTVENLAYGRFLEMPKFDRFNKDDMQTRFVFREVL
mgnify:CR=1 FL=1